MTIQATTISINSQLLKVISKSFDTGKHDFLDELRTHLINYTKYKNKTLLTLNTRTYSSSINEINELLRVTKKDEVNPVFKNYIDIIYLLLLEIKS